MNHYDEAAFRTLADPACIEALLEHGPVLDATSSILELRAMGQRALEALGPLPLPEGVTLREESGPRGTRLRVFSPEVRTLPRSGVFWIHGGGLIAGVPEQDDQLCARMAVSHGCPVVATSYSLAPERPFPAGLEDCVAALEWTLTSDLGVDRVLVAGASAGGGLALATAMVARDRGIDGVCALLLHYPMLDDRPGLPSVERTVFDKTWHREMNAMAWGAYLSATPGEVPAVAAPARARAADLRGLPPTYIDVGTLDAFYDEDLALARALADAGVPVELVVTPGAFHASEIIVPSAPTSRRIDAARAGFRHRALHGTV